ncbi:MAG: hypothetical protein DRI44_02740, partial [Chlamydiae bacterium]
CSFAKKEQYDVPVPKPVKTNIKVGTYIFPGWYRGKGSNAFPRVNIDNDSEWRLIAKYPKPRPVLGFYDDSLPEVNDWHIKWAVEAGISFFVFDWYWNAGETRLARTLNVGFLNAKYTDMMKFCIHWCNHNLDWKPNRETGISRDVARTSPSANLDFSPKALTEMIEYCATNYFLLPNYLKINNRPVFMVWDMQAVINVNGGAENFKKKILPEINAVCKKYGFDNLFLVAVNNQPQNLDKTGIADAITRYGFADLITRSKYKTPGSAPYKEMVELLPGYWERMRTLKTPYIVSTQAGWDDTPRATKLSWIRTDNNVILFKQTLREGRDAVKPNLPLFIIEAWNEWGEGSFIEPSHEFGFTQLDAIRRVFAPNAPINKWARPTKKQILKYSVFNGKELASARDKEKEPPLPPPPRHLWSTVFTTDPKNITGKIIDEIKFDKTNVVAGSNGVKIKGIKSGRLICEVTGNDPKIYFKGNWGDFSKVKAIEIKLKYRGTSYNIAELFWQTPSMQMSQETARRYPWYIDGKSHTYLIKFRKDYQRTGKLNTIRIDFPDSPGAIAEIKYLKILK